MHRFAPTITWLLVVLGCGPGLDAPGRALVSLEDTGLSTEDIAEPTDDSAGSVLDVAEAADVVAEDARSLGDAQIGVDTADGPLPLEDISFDQRLGCWHHRMCDSDQVCSNRDGLPTQCQSLPKHGAFCVSDDDCNNGLPTEVQAVCREDFQECARGCSAHADCPQGWRCHWSLNFGRGKCVKNSTVEACEGCNDPLTNAICVIDGDSPSCDKGPCKFSAECGNTTENPVDCLISAGQPQSGQCRPTELARCRGGLVRLPKASGAAADEWCLSPIPCSPVSECPEGFSCERVANLVGDPNIPGQYCAARASNTTVLPLQVLQKFVECSAAQ